MENRQILKFNFDESGENFTYTILEPYSDGIYPVMAVRWEYSDSDFYVRCYSREELLPYLQLGLNTSARYIRHWKTANGGLLANKPEYRKERLAEVKAKKQQIKDFIDVCKRPFNPLGGIQYTTKNLLDYPVVDNPSMPTTAYTRTWTDQVVPLGSPPKKPIVEQPIVERIEELESRVDDAEFDLLKLGNLDADEIEQRFEDIELVIREHKEMLDSTKVHTAGINEYKVEAY